MKGSTKANLIVFLVIAVIAFCISSAFANLTIHEDNDSYKLISLDDDSFEPKYVDYVPTIIPKNNTTNTTNDTIIDDTTDDDSDNWTEGYEELWEDFYEE